MPIAFVFMAFGWYSVIGRRVAPPIDVNAGTFLSYDGTSRFTTDGTSILSTI